METEVYDGRKAAAGNTNTGKAKGRKSGRNRTAAGGNDARGRHTAISVSAVYGTDAAAAYLEIRPQERQYKGEECSLRKSIADPHRNAIFRITLGCIYFALNYIFYREDQGNKLLNKFEIRIAKVQPL